MEVVDPAAGDQGRTPEQERLVAISRAQIAAHGREGALAVWTGSALYPKAVFGHKGYLPVQVCLTDDGLLRCTTAEGDLIWGVSVLAPNACRMKRAAFWVSRIDGKEDDACFGRLHPFTVCFLDEKDLAIPYVGLWALRQGARRARPLREALRSVGATFE
ncbi:MAG TPA: hypothetical protein VKV06_00240 [Acidimicrobiales bacterium]|nr:hypothetical protein [Acidimicrobiales bacterium]